MGTTNDFFQQLGKQLFPMEMLNSSVSDGAILTAVPLSIQIEIHKINMQLVSSISLPPKLYASATCTSKVHVYIRTQLQKHSTQTVDTGSRVLFVDITFTKLRGLPTSEKSCQFNARSITFTATSL